MEKLEVLGCGANYKHEKDFYYLERGESFRDCYLFLFFKTPFLSDTQDGIKRGDAYSYILYKPKSPAYHSSLPESPTGFINDWMYLKGEYVDVLVEEMHISTDIIVPLYNKNKISAIINEIEIEKRDPLPFKERRIKSLVSELFVEVARSDYRTQGYTNNREFNIISDAKSIVIKDYKNDWSLDKMAKLTGFSVSQFVFQYKKYYKESPINDLINYRLSKAQFMLESGNDSISKIAMDCGFSTPYYFSRIFKKRLGVSPKEYRKKYFA